MSVSPPDRSMLHAALSGAAVALCFGLVAFLAAGWVSMRPIEVTVDGTAVELSIGTTVQDLAEDGLLAGRPGDLLGVDGSLVARSGGRPAEVLRNGEPVSPVQRLYDGDVIESRDGMSRVESIVVADEPVPFKTVTEGTGSIIDIKTIGATGLIRVTRGALSGAEVTRTVVREAQDEVYVKSRPGKGAKLVALTFDDGPQKGQTEEVLNILRKNDVKATFFVIGSQVSRHPAIVRRAIAEGHQVANHTFSHADLGRTSNADIRKEVKVGQQRIRKVTGQPTTPWLRPPYGSMNSRVWGVLRGIDQRVVLWDVDPQDWRRPGTAKIADNVINNTKPGSVILLHDGGTDRRQTIAALPKIIRVLKERGYEFVTVEELAAAK